MNRFAFQNCVGVIAAAIVFAGIQAGQSRAADTAPAQTAPATFGSVDMDAVGQSSKNYAKDKDELTTFLNKLRNVSSELQNGSGLFLSNDQMRELAALYEKDTLSDAEKKRVAELEQIGDSRKGELSRLENTATPTDDQRKRFTELNTMHQQGEQNLNGLNQDFEGRLHTKEDEITKKAIQEIKDAVAVVAKQKGLSVVFDGKVAVYTSNDITADVTKQINK